MMSYPYLRKRHNGDGMRIEIMADSMRVGKTTAMQVISEGFKKLGKNVHESNEDWQHNPYLQKSYADPAKNFLESQKWFIKRKWEQIKEGSDLDVFIQDVTPEMDYCYAETNRRLGRMNSAHFTEYQTFYHSLEWDQAPAPDLLVYLEVSDNVLIQRAMDSRREFEDVDPSYFLMMKKVNRKWIEGAEQATEYSVLRVNTDTLDFAHEERAKEELFENVRVKLDVL